MSPGGDEGPLGEPLSAVLSHITLLMEDSDRHPQPEGGGQDRFLGQPYQTLWKERTEFELLLDFGCQLLFLSSSGILSFR